jgi:hypothetical protein
LSLNIDVSLPFSRMFIVCVGLLIKDFAILSLGSKGNAWCS